MMGIGSFVAGSNLLRALVDGADVSDHVGLDGVLAGGGVDIVDDDPGDVGVAGDEVLSGNGHLDQVVDTSLRGTTIFDGAPVKAMLLGALIALGSPVAGVGLEADDEGQGLGVLVVELEGAGLNEVSLALADAVLAGEGPAGAILLAASIAVGVEVEIADLPEVSSVGCSLEGAHDVLLAVGAERFKVEIHLHTVVIGHAHQVVPNRHAGKTSQHQQRHCFVHLIGIIIILDRIFNLNVSGYHEIPYHMTHLKKLKSEWEQEWKWKWKICQNVRQPQQYFRSIYL